MFFELSIMSKDIFILKQSGRSIYCKLWTFLRYNAWLIMTNWWTILWSYYRSVQSCVLPAVVSVNKWLIEVCDRIGSVKYCGKTWTSAVLHLLQAVLSIHSACMSRYVSHETNKSMLGSSGSWIYGVSVAQVWFCSVWLEFRHFWGFFTRFWGEFNVEACNNSWRWIVRINQTSLKLTSGIQQMPHRCISLCLNDL